MPIVAPWTVGIITFEGTMLGVVLATFAALLIELRLRPSRVGPTIRAWWTAASSLRSTVQTSDGLRLKTPSPPPGN